MSTASSASNPTAPLPQTRSGARICDFLPESLIEVAHHKKLAITMHLAKPTGPADPDNQRDLARYTREYPNAQWILAHCARSFNSFMMEEAIHFLCDLPNIWYDTSAVNDLYAHYLLMKHEDRKRVMFGSDNVVAGCARGKYITYGRAWLFYPGNEAGTPHCDSRATLVIYEQLRPGAASGRDAATNTRGNRRSLCRERPAISGDDARRGSVKNELV